MTHLIAGNSLSSSLCVTRVRIQVRQLLRIHQCVLLGYTFKYILVATYISVCVARVRVQVHWLLTCYVHVSVLLGCTYKYIGCYRDEATNRDLNGYDIGTTDLVTCAGQCRNLGNPYVGLQAGERCSCGMTYGKHGATLSKLAKLTSIHSNVTKASGPDNISNGILRDTAEVLAEPISSLQITKLVNSGDFPSKWKLERANVTPTLNLPCPRIL